MRSALESTLRARDLVDDRPELAAQVMLLRHLAKALDEEMTAPLAAQFRLTLARLLEAPPRMDDRDDVLRELRAL